ncbi:pimeloyl-ACP methyl ester carboxylesterase [Marmoricola sp. OAE513]|uniref:alpha/beta hydrolase n=1 Tax=Marmoricola sp. OAE513 TaxID=2817894 RepID=UPI001E000267
MSLTPPGPPVPPPPSEPVGPQGEESRSGNPVLLGILVGLLVFALVGAGVGAWLLVSDSEDPLDGGNAGPTFTPAPSSTAPLPETEPSLDRYYDQKLRWKRCGENRCATLKVPMDYTKPDGAEIGIAVLKVPATDEKNRVGSLVVNPGGPGGSGTEFAAAGPLQFGNALTRYFDIVGFDPRGVASSDPLACLDTAGLDEVVAFDPDPDNPAEEASMDRLLGRFGQGCLDESGELARHMSTKEAARDMDVLRAALGESKLDYLGSSYGTFLGATYADLFPKNVGRFVLDGAIDPSLSNEKLSLEQGRGFETALRAYIKDCIDAGGCYLGSTVDGGARKVRAFLDDLDAKPLQTGESRELTEGLGMLGIWLPLYVKELWPDLTQALRSAMRTGDGSGLLGLADRYTARGPKGFRDNSMEALYAVNCLDHNDYIATKDVAARFPEFEKASPTFGRAFAYSLATCSNWPIRSGQRTVALHAKGAPPIVVIGTTRDPATPLVWAQALAAQLDSGQLITRDGDGHTGFGRGNSCVDDAVEKWLISGDRPQVDLKC